uniref:INV4 n=1 Tax=Arundo donax TaxID=35708 RepID=A0A0A8YSX1_ARUDO
MNLTFSAGTESRPHRESSCIHNLQRSPLSSAASIELHTTSSLPRTGSTIQMDLCTTMVSITNSTSIIQTVHSGVT